VILLGTSIPTTILKVINPMYALGGGTLTIWTLALKCVERGGTAIFFGSASEDATIPATIMIFSGEQR
jgi:hypothetical protein